MSNAAQKDLVALQEKKRKLARKRGIEVYKRHFSAKEGRKKYELALLLMGQNSRPD